MKSSEKHPDLLALELARTGEANRATIEHVKRCAECQAAVAELQAARDMLAGAVGKMPEIPASVDQNIRAVIHERGAEIRRAGFGARRLAGWGAAAAVLLALVVLPLLIGLTYTSPAREVRDELKPVDACDIDQNGAIDILDAYTLAVMIREGRADARFDLNKDGVVNNDDVDFIAKRAVRIKREG